VDLIGHNVANNYQTTFIKPLMICSLVVAGVNCLSHFVVDHLHVTAGNLEVLGLDTVLSFRGV
jgi:hypothetical protein